LKSFLIILFKNLLLKKRNDGLNNSEIILTSKLDNSERITLNFSFLIWSAWEIYECRKKLPHFITELWSETSNMLGLTVLVG